MTLIERAALFAEQAHRGQVRKYTGEPYINHPREVSRLVSHFAGEDSQAAALLHDVVEDTDCTLEMIQAEFGFDVANLVFWLTDASKKDDGNRATRKAIDRAHTAAAPHEAQLIKLADLISNTSTIVRFDPDFAKVYLSEKRALLEVISFRGALYDIATMLARK